MARNPQTATHLIPGHYGLTLVGMYLLAFGSALIYGPVYWLRDRDSSLVKSIAYAHLFTALRLHVGLPPDGGPCGGRSGTGRTGPRQHGPLKSYRRHTSHEPYIRRHDPSGPQGHGHLRYRAGSHQDGSAHPGPAGRRGLRAPDRGHRPASSMLDQVLDVFGLFPHHDLDIGRDRQTLTGVTQRALGGLDG